MWVPYFDSCEILPCPFSDHCALLSFILVPGVVPPGPGFWKLNTSILQDDEYVKLISDAWLNWRTSIHRFPSLAKWWEEGMGLIIKLLLLKVIHLEVYKDQTCVVPRRFVAKNVALLRDFVDFASFSDTPVAVLSLGQEKASDWVDWSFMRATLSSTGFGSSFIDWVNLFYHRVQSSVNVNGCLSSFFGLSRGVRQGCPLSPLLYVLDSEVIAVNIRCNRRISGLCLPGSSML